MTDKQECAMISENDVLAESLPISDLFHSYICGQDTTPLFLPGNALSVLKALPDSSIDCCMTSPPYWNKRQYHDGGIGLEDDYKDYITNLLTIFEQVKRVLKSTGSFWLNMGDSYQQKTLLGLPWRIAIKLIDDQGWILRNSIIWDKVKGGPDNTQDRLRNVHEDLFHLVKTSKEYYYRELEKIGRILEKLADKDLFPWLEAKHIPNERELFRAATVVADRLCGAATDPIIRNAQEQRQLQAIAQWLDVRGYVQMKSRPGMRYSDMSPGTFSFRLNMPVVPEDQRKVNIPIDTVIMPKGAKAGQLPLLIEAKSAGDFTNTNKRRKEEATKFTQLQRSYGQHIRFILFLCGYFDAGYLGYEASEGIDWVWEHRIDDLAEFGV